MLQCDFAQISDFPERFEQNSSPDRFGLAGELRRIERQAFPVDAGELAVPPVRQVVQPRSILTRQAGGTGDRGRNYTSIRRIEFRNYSMPDAIPGIRQIGVRFIVHPRFAKAGEVLAEVAPRGVQQRTNERSPAWIDATQPGQSGTANQLQEKRLRLVVPGVASGDPVGAKVRGAAVQECIPRTACGFLDAELFRRCIFGDIHGVDHSADSQPLTQGAAELLITGSGWTQVMVEVSETGNIEASIRRELAKDERESHRVRATGEGDEHTAA